MPYLHVVLNQFLILSVGYLILLSTFIGFRHKIKTNSFNNYQLQTFVIIQLINRKYYMEGCARTFTGFTNKQLPIINKYRERIREIEEKAICEQIVTKDTNNLEFYKITPKDQLPKFLQKMKFKTLHLKEKDITSSIKIYKKENRKIEEKQVRKKLKAEGQIMLLSEIYQKLGESGDVHKRSTTHNNSKHSDPTGDLEDWEKLLRQEKLGLTSTKPKNKQISEARHSLTTHQESSKNKQTILPKEFRQGADYKGDIQRALGIIEMTHSSEYNLMNRYLLVQNSSKLLKKDLDEKKARVEGSIKSKMKQLYEARTQYHNFYEQKNRIKIEERLLNEDMSQEDPLRVSHKSLKSIQFDKNNQFKIQKRNLLEANQTKIQRTKKIIQTLEQSIYLLQEQLRKIMVAEKIYYKISLKNGNDVRDTGLVWIIRRLQIKEDDMIHYDYPQFLDKKCRLFLIQKAASEQEEEKLLQEKRKFVNQIGRSTSDAKFKYKSILSPKAILGNDRGDKIIENDFNESVPKKYRRSLKKITQLNQQYIKNSSLLCQLRERENDGNKLFEISADLQGMSNKQIYSQIGERIKKLDLSKMKKDKLGSKKLKLIQYQSLLEKIKNIHIKLEQMDLQIENHLLGHYRDNQNIYFMQAAACLGYKRAYSMIIKHFSWKTYQDGQQ